jgi:hypothetical protein
MIYYDSQVSELERPKLGTDSVAAGVAVSSDTEARGEPGGAFLAHRDGGPSDGLNYRDRDRFIKYPIVISSDG